MGLMCTKLSDNSVAQLPNGEQLVGAFGVGCEHIATGSAGCEGKQQEVGVGAYEQKGGRGRSRRGRLQNSVHVLQELELTLAVDVRCAH